MTVPKLPLHPEALAALERRGVPAITASLVHLAGYDGTALPKPELQLAFVLRESETGAVYVTRRDVETWLAWKSAREFLWVKIGVAAAIAAAILAAFSWLLPLK